MTKPHTWLEFWGRQHSIYVNQRHLEAHYRRIADDILALAPGPADRVLDFGCGEALEAPRVAARVGELLLFDGAPEVHARLRARLAAARRVRVLDEPDYSALPEGSLDLILAVSVLQYLPTDQLDPLLARWHRLLADSGRLVLADVIPPDAGVLADIGALLGFAARQGFLLAAIRGLVATFFSDYRRLRQRLGLLAISEAELLARLHEAGFAAERSPRNLGFNQRRMTFVARRRP